MLPFERHHVLIGNLTQPVAQPLHLVVESIPRLFFQLSDEIGEASFVELQLLDRLLSLAEISRGFHVVSPKSFEFFFQPFEIASRPLD